MLSAGVLARCHGPSELPAVFASSCAATPRLRSSRYLVVPRCHCFQTIDRSRRRIHCFCHSSVVESRRVLIRPRLAAGVISPLRFAITSPPSGCEEDLHLQAVDHVLLGPSGPRNLMKITRAEQKYKRLGAARLTEHWKS